MLFSFSVLAITINNNQVPQLVTAQWAKSGFFVQWVYWVYLFSQNTRPLLQLKKWFLHQNGVESNQISKSDMYKLLGGVWRCMSYQKMCSRWLLA